MPAVRTPVLCISWAAVSALLSPASLPAQTAKPAVCPRAVEHTTRPAVIKRVEPYYPPLAMQARIEGQVKLSLVITCEGTASHVQVISGHPLLVQTSLEAVRQWQFEVTMQSGHPVEVTTTVDLTFSLDEPDGNQPDDTVRPSPSQRLLSRSHRQIQNGQYEEARVALWTFLRENPSDGPIRQQLVYVFSLMYRNSEAIEELRDALRSAPTDSSMHEQLFHLLVESDLADEAINHFNVMRRFREPNPSTFASVGLLLYRLQNPQSAASEFSVMVQDSSDPCEAHGQLAKDLLLALRLEPALHHVNETLRACTDAGQFQNVQQEILFARKLLERGMPVLYARLQQDPRQPVVRAALAFGLLAQGKWESEGRRHYRAAIEGGFDDPGADQDLANILRTRYGAKAAIAEMQGFGRVRSSPGLRLAIADLLEEAGDLQAAIAEVRIAVAESPGDPHIRHRLAEELRRAGDSAGAKAEAELAERLPEQSLPGGQTLESLVSELVALLEEEELRKDPVRANEVSTVGAIRTINTACVQYSSTYDVGYPLSLASLGPPPGGAQASVYYADLIDSTLASGTTSGYKFTYFVTATDEKGQPAAYEIYADPVQPGTTGNRWFYTDQSGVVRVSTGGRAGPASPPLQ